MSMSSFMTFVGAATYAASVTTCVIPFGSGTTSEEPLVMTKCQMSTPIGGNEFSLSSSSPSVSVIEVKAEDKAHLNEYEEDIDFEPEWERIPVTLEVVKVSNFVPEFELEDVYEEL